jgi:hypothetical protein
LGSQKPNEKWVTRYNFSEYYKKRVKIIKGFSQVASVEDVHVAGGTGLSGKAG